MDAADQSAREKQGYGDGLTQAAVSQRIQALEQALIEAASQPEERRRRGQQAAAEAVQRYGWAAIATQVARVYEKAVAQQSEETDAQTPRKRARG